MYHKINEVKGNTRNVKANTGKAAITIYPEISKLTQMKQM
jgi:hypothetical protein